jgi:hypothetical protein
MKDYWKQAIFFTITIYLVTVSFLLVLLYENSSKKEFLKKQEIETANLFLKDSLEIEYYKAQIKFYNQYDSINCPN